jgi:hypothetical protein
VRTLVYALCAGFLLSASRAPLGLELATIPAATAWQCAIFRFGGLLAVALSLGRSARWFGARVPILTLLLGCTAGFAVHGLLAAGRFEIQSWLGWIAVLAVGSQALYWLARRPRELGEDAPSAESPAPSWLARSGLFLAGLGVALALEATARPLRLLGGARPEDDTLFALTLLACISIGAMAFGPLLVHGERSAGLLSAGLAAAAASCMFALAFLGDLSTRGGLDAYVRLFGIDLSLQGTLPYDLLIGARTFVVPGFVLGAALYCVRDRAELSSVLAGAACAMLALPLVIQWTVDPGETFFLAELPAQRVLIGTVCAALGAVLALSSARKTALSARFAGIAVALIATVAAALAIRTRALPISPWEKFPIEPTWMRELPEGLVTVEPSKGGALVVTLDRRRLTPLAGEERGDELRLTDSVGSQARLTGRVLLHGQLTPSRALALRALGATAIDRTAPWHACMAEIEALLFDQGPLPAGEILAPGRAPSTPPELTIVPSVQGPSPATRAVLALDDGPGSPRVVAWLRGDQSIAARDWSDRVLLTIPSIDELGVGVLGGDAAAWASAAPELLPASDWQLSLTPQARMRLRCFERDHAALALTTRRLAHGTEGSPHAKLTKGLAILCAAQVRSSPYETGSQAVELDTSALELLREGTLSRPADRPLPTFERELWEFLAKVLAQKREIDLIDTFIEPVAKARFPWPALERALAKADWEALDYAAAAGRLERVIAASPYDVQLHRWRAEALLLAERPAEAAAELQSALAIQPARPDLERELAVALARARDPTAHQRIEALLAANPADEELRSYLGPGPFPPLKTPEFEGRFE